VHSRVTPAANQDKRFRSPITEEASRRGNRQHDRRRVATQHHQQHQPPDRHLDVDASNRRRENDRPPGGLDPGALGHQAGALTLQVGEHRGLLLPTSGELGPLLRRVGGQIQRDFVSPRLVASSTAPST